MTLTTGGAMQYLTKLPGTLLLGGVVGSHAYGLNTPQSDVDFLGMYAAPTVDLLRLQEPSQTTVFLDPDATFHEAKKFVHLVTKGNPTVTELLFLDRYTVVHPLGQALVDVRTQLLCAHRVRNSYLGYATSQFARLWGRADGSFSADTRKRTAKHARHLLRLVEQGFQLYSTGTITLRLEDPQRFHDFGEEVASDLTSGLVAANAVLAEAEKRFDATTSALADSVDMDAVNDWLLMVRRRFWM